jgi:hypothetical protein
MACCRCCSAVGILDASWLAEALRRGRHGLSGKAGHDLVRGLVQGGAWPGVVGVMEWAYCMLAGWLGTGEGRRRLSMDAGHDLVRGGAEHVAGCWCQVSAVVACCRIMIRLRADHLPQLESGMAGLKAGHAG